MIAQNVKIEGRNVELGSGLIGYIEARLENIQRHYANLIKSIRIDIIGSEHHRQGAFEVRMVATVPSSLIFVRKKGERLGPLMGQALDAMHAQFMRQKRGLQGQNCCPV